MGKCGYGVHFGIGIDRNALVYSDQRGSQVVNCCWRLCLCTFTRGQIKWPKEKVGRYHSYEQVNPLFC